jgi:hypothetical protein
MTATAAEPSPRRFSLFHLILVVPWIAIVIDAFKPITDNSFLWHIRAGELQATSASVLTTDPFSFTMHGEHWLTQSWLAELAYYWGERTWAGLGFVPWIMLLLNTVTFVGIGLIAYRRSKSVVGTAIVVGLSTLVLLEFLVPRPVIFSFTLFVLVILAWDRPSTRWAVPLLFWIWASVHGSFVLGLAYIGLSLLAKKEWKALPTAIVSGLATLVTAHGLGVVSMLVDFSRAGDALALLSEWQRPEFLSWVFTPFLIGAAILVYGGYKQRIRGSDAWIIVPFLALGFTAMRAVPPAWLALIPVISTCLLGVGDRVPRRFSKPVAVTFAGVVLVTPFLLVRPIQLDEERFPIAAATMLEQVNTFHDDRAGGYLIWAMGPDFQVYLDDRAELYGDRIAEFAGIRDGTVDWEPVFERDGIEQVLLRVDEPVVEEAIAAGWSPVYQDDFYVVLRLEE